MLESETAACRSSQYFETVLFHNGQQLERHAARPFGSGFPFLHRRFAGLASTSKPAVPMMATWQYCAACRPRCSSINSRAAVPWVANCCANTSALASPMSIWCRLIIARHSSRLASASASALAPVSVSARSASCSQGSVKAALSAAKSGSSPHSGLHQPPTGSR